MHALAQTPPLPFARLVPAPGAQRVPLDDAVFHVTTATGFLLIRGFDLLIETVRDVRFGAPGAEQALDCDHIHKALGQDRD